MYKKQTSQIPNILLSVKDASAAISVSTKTMRLLIASGRLKAVNLGQRMTRISLPSYSAKLKQVWLCSRYSVNSI